MIPYLDADAIRRSLSPSAAVDAITAALRSGLDPAASVARTSVPLSHGELLMMPAEAGGHAGVKLATVAPGNADRGLPRINAVYALFDSETLQPVALLDGAALTTLRTPAVTVAALQPALDRLGALRVVVFGAGPQGHSHAETLAARYDVASLDVVSSQGVRPALRDANVIICATTSTQPVFDSSELRDDAVVAAIGAHTPDAREVDAAFCGRATVIVEDPATALRECGDVVLAIAAGSLTPDRLVPMASVVRGTYVVPPGPVFYKGSGMSWQDLVIASAVLSHLVPPPSVPPPPIPPIMNSRS
ncbi:ornithine cyclodeaminase family protein [Hamadaea sp. NPDC050747]|uniref:ornithine cyclodeaminase family protein n=1 Tax=Hamadaea sp. NPDC050747 TaxID=3155789 RepID=UPI003410D3A6